MNIALEDSLSLKDDHEECQDHEEEDDDEWILPPGADQIIRQIAAEQILFELLGDIFSMAVIGRASSNKRQKRAEFAVIKNICIEFPAVCQRRYEFKWEDGATRELFPLAALCCLRPPIDVLKVVLHANSPALEFAESTRLSLPMHYACGFGASLNAIQFLYDAYPSSISIGRKDMVTPLHLACAYYKGGEPDVINFLLDKYPEGARQLATDMGWLPLHSAAHGGTPKTVLQRLESLAPDGIRTTDSNGRTPLHVACERKGNLEGVKFLLSKAQHFIDMEDGSRFTPISLAAMHQSVEVLKMLLSHRETLEDQHGVTLLHMAAFQNTTDVIDFIADRYPYMIKARVRDGDMYTPLLAACRHGASPDVVRALIRWDRSTLSMPDGYGRPPLESARQSGADVGILQVLQEEMNAVAAASFTETWPPPFAPPTFFTSLSHYPLVARDLTLEQNLEETPLIDSEPLLERSQSSNESICFPWRWFRGWRRK